jgi:acyl-CoA synthetase (AMP-forming)/AMP-acid ligase II
MHHGYGLGVLFAGLVSGRPVVLRRRVDTETTLADIDRYDAGMLGAVPTTLKRLLDVPPDARRAHDISSLQLIISGGAALSPALCTALMDEFGDIVVNAYGATELGAGAIAVPAELRVAPGTVGPAAPTARIRIVGRDGREVPSGTTGEIELNKLYDPRRLGYVATGDLGHLDEHGRLFIDGRADDMIVSGGENVYPQEVEALLQTHHAVADAAVIGVPDEEFGQRLAAFVIVKPDSVMSAEQVRTFVKENLSRAKVPRDMHVVDELPRTTTGKLQRQRLVDLLPGSMSGGASVCPADNGGNVGWSRARPE